MLILLLLVGTAVAQQSPTCGRKPSQAPMYGPHIVNGREAGANSWPWQLSMEFHSSTGRWGHTCGAILIANNYAISAAHCTDPEMDPRRGDPKNFRLVAAQHDRVNRKGNEQFLTVTKITNHKDFVLDPLWGVPNDISILQLGTVADTSRPEITEACIPLDPNTEWGGNPNCWITGWGLTDFWEGVLPDRLQEGNVPVWTYDQCLERHFGVILRTHICVGEGEVGKPNACQGDSGGPLNCPGKDGRWYAAGITSWGVLGCEIAPAVYTHVAKYAGWIKENTGIGY